MERANTKLDNHLVGEISTTTQDHQFRQNIFVKLQLKGILELLSRWWQSFSCWFYQNTQKLKSSDRVIKKFELLSAASNVLLAEFENNPLSEKYDFIVEKATEILDAELCSLWLVKDGHVSLETSYSQEGKVRPKEDVVLPIKGGPRSGMTEYIAFHKKVFNAFGKALENHPARKPENPVDFVQSNKMYSELAYPILDDKNLIGLLFAYNKKRANGKPLKIAGFSKEFDEPLMKILTTKLVISIKNARLLEQQRDLLKKQSDLLKKLKDFGAGIK